MTKNEKKELFLLILENWFNDDSGQINENNCIGFYHYFIDCLEFEIKFCPEYKLGLNEFLSLSTDLLINFPSYSKYNISDKIGLKNIIITSKKSINNEDIDAFMKYFKELFLMCKDEYLL